MKDERFISIIMPVFNAEKYLDECLQSIVDQSFANWELHIVNDFSTDASPAVIEEWCKKDHRIKLHQNKEKGIISALELAFKQSIGRYITRMDADDKMPPNKLQLFAKQAILNPKAVITGKVEYFSDNQVTSGYLRYEAWLNDLVDSNEFWKSVYRECVIASPNWMVERTCFQSGFSFSDLEYPEDYDMVLKWYEYGYEISTIPEVTHFWREHPQRTSRNSENYQQKAFFRLKTQRFIDLELHPGEIKTIQLIGAGVKGKLVATVLDKNDLSYEWFDFNADKNMGNSVNQIKSLSAVKPETMTILTVWPEDEKLKAQVMKFLNDKQLVLGKNCWLF